MVEIALISNNKTAQSYSDVTFSGSYAKSEGKTGRKGGEGSLSCTYKIFMKTNYW